MQSKHTDPIGHLRKTKTGTELRRAAMAVTQVAFSDLVSFSDARKGVVDVRASKNLD